MSTIRITKVLAIDIIKKVFEPSKKELLKKVEEHNTRLYELYLAQIPAAAKEYILQCPSHQTQKDYVGLNNSEGMSTIDHYPKWTDSPATELINTSDLSRKRFNVLQCYSHGTLNISQLTDEEKKEVKESAKEVSLYRESIKKNAEEMYNTLLQLKTKKKVLEVFPELEKFFPKEVAQTPAVINYKVKEFITNQPI